MLGEPLSQVGLSVNQLLTQPELTANLLGFHFASSQTVFSPAIRDSTTFDGLQFNVVNGTVSVIDGDASSSDAVVTTADVLTTQGVIHKVDSVLLPQDFITSIVGPTPEAPTSGAASISFTVLSAVLVALLL